MTHASNPLHIPLDHGGFIDTSVAYMHDGELWYLEWSPELTEKPVRRADGLKLARECRINGHEDWDAPTAKEALAGLVDHEVNRPASRVLGIHSDWYITSTDDVLSGLAVYVHLNDGSVSRDSQYDNGRVRACRCVRVSEIG